MQKHITSTTLLSGILRGNIPTSGYFVPLNISGRCDAACDSEMLRFLYTSDLELYVQTVCVCVCVCVCV